MIANLLRVQTPLEYASVEVLTCSGANGAKRRAGRKPGARVTNRATPNSKVGSSGYTFMSRTTGRHFVCACAKIRLISSPNSIFTRSDKNTNFGAIFSHFTLKYLRLTIHKLTGKRRKFLKTNCKFKIGCGIKYIFAGKTRNIWMLT